MKNTKRFLAGVLAFSTMLGLTACGGGSGSDSSNSGSSSNGGDAAAAETTAETTTTAGVEINTETLKDDEQAVIEKAAEQLKDVELENTEIKWLSTWDINPDTSGKSKPLPLELFETKYNGKITWYKTDWNNRYTDLSTYVLGGEGIDFFPAGDQDGFPMGAASGMFAPFDDYVDWNDEFWSPVKEANDKLKFNGGHYVAITDVVANEVVIYNRKTIEDYGLDDPKDLLENDNWTWDTFKSMLMEYCNPDEDRYGLDGFWNEKALMLSTGVPSIGFDDSGKLVSNINDPNMERAMNFMYDLNQNKLTFDMEQFGWAEQPAFMSEGKELFFLAGLWKLYGAPELWASFGTPDEVMFVPVPKDPEADNYYYSASFDAVYFCSNGANPEGVARFLECRRVAATDPDTLALGDEQMKRDYGWTDEMVEMKKKCDDVARANPVFDVYTGVSQELTTVLDSGENGVRSAFRGIDWATTRSAIADFVQGEVDKLNSKVSG